MAKTKKAEMKSAETTSNLGTAGGVAAGAALGSLLGPLGAAVGAVVGGIAGGKAGKAAQAKPKPKRKPAARTRMKSAAAKSAAKKAFGEGTCGQEERPRSGSNNPWYFGAGCRPALAVAIIGVFPPTSARRRRTIRCSIPGTHYGLSGYTVHPAALGC